MILTYLWPSGQDHQTWYELPGYNHAKFERLPLNCVHQKANSKVFVKSENISILSLEHVQKWKTVQYWKVFNLTA